MSAIDIGTGVTKQIMVTASFGITMLDPSVSVEKSINRADTALYATRRPGVIECVSGIPLRHLFGKAATFFKIPIIGGKE
jgi:PleD family two-component response regulator